MRKQSKTKKQKRKPQKVPEPETASNEEFFDALSSLLKQQDLSTECSLEVSTEDSSKDPSRNTAASESVAQHEAEPPTGSSPSKKQSDENTKLREKINKESVKHPDVENLDNSKSHNDGCNSNIVEGSVKESGRSQKGPSEEPSHDASNTAAVDRTISENDVFEVVNTVQNPHIEPPQHANLENIEQILETCNSSVSLKPVVGVNIAAELATIPEGVLTTESRSEVVNSYTAHCLPVHNMGNFTQKPANDNRLNEDSADVNQNNQETSTSPNGTVFLIGDKRNADDVPSVDTTPTTALSATYTTSMPATVADGNIITTTSTTNSTLDSDDERLNKLSNMLNSSDGKQLLHNDHEGHYELSPNTCAADAQAANNSDHQSQAETGNVATSDSITEPSYIDTDRTDSHDDNPDSVRKVFRTSDQPVTTQRSSSSVTGSKPTKLKLHNSVCGTLVKSSECMPQKRVVVSPSKFSDDSGSLCSMDQSLADSSSLCSASNYSPDFDADNQDSPSPLAASITDSCRDASSLDSMFLGAFSKFKSKRWRRSKRNDQSSQGVGIHFNIGQKVRYAYYIYN